MADYGALSDRQLDELLARLEGRVRAAIAIGEGDLISDLLSGYLEAHEESHRRFREWVSRRATRFRDCPALRQTGALAG